MCVCTTWLPGAYERKSVDAVGFPAGRAKGSCEPPGGSWELNQVLCKSRQALNCQAIFLVSGSGIFEYTSTFLRSRRQQKQKIYFIIFFSLLCLHFWESFSCFLFLSLSFSICPLGLNQYMNHLNSLQTLKYIFCTFSSRSMF